MIYSHHITPTHLAPMCQIALRWTASQWLLRVLNDRAADDVLSTPHWMTTLRIVLHSWSLLQLPYLD